MDIKLKLHIDTLKLVLGVVTLINISTVFINIYYLRINQSNIPTTEVALIVQELVEVIVEKKEPVLEIKNQDDLNDLLQNSNKSSVIFFYMDGCGWCKKMEPVFAEVAENPEFASVGFYHLNGRHTNAASLVSDLFDEKINGYPFILFVDKGKFVQKQVGFAQQEDLEDKIYDFLKKENHLPRKKSAKKIDSEPKKVVKPTTSTKDSPEARQIVEDFIKNSNQLPNEKFTGFRKIEDEQLQLKVDSAYNSYKRLYENKDNFYISREENTQINEGAVKLFNLVQIRNMVWRGHVKK